MKQSGIYRIVNKVNGKGYVGSAKILNERRNTHFYWLRHDNHHNPHLQVAWNKYGEDAFRFEVLEIVKDQLQLTTREQYWIDFYDAANPEKGYNIEPDAISHTHSEEMRKKIGDGNRGKFVSLETRKKQSAALLGIKHPMFRKKLPKEWRDNIGKGAIGRVVSSETREKLRLANFGKKHGSQVQTIERKQQIREFINKFGFKPTKWSKDLHEKKLGKSLSHYIDKTNDSQYDLDFVTEMSTFPTWQQFKKLHKEK